MVGAFAMLFTYVQILNISRVPQAVLSFLLYRQTRGEIRHAQTKFPYPTREYQPIYASGCVRSNLGFSAR